MMIQIGNFFFKYRNWIFVPLYLTLFLPSPEFLGPKYHAVSLFAGLLCAIAGQAIRGATIGLAYIRRGGRNKQVYAPHLVTEGIFSHCRNPLYIGNILMLLGVGILSNSLLFIGLVVPVFLFIYQAMVLAEENFLRGKFDADFEAYCRRVNRWLPVFSGLTETFHSMEFNWQRWVVKELSTQYVLLLGILFLLLFKYPELTGGDASLRNGVLIVSVTVLTAVFLYVRSLKKRRIIQG